LTFDVFKMGNDFVRWSFNYAADLLNREVSENEIQAQHKKILNFILRQGEAGASSTQLAKYCQGMKARDRNEILQTLLDSGDITEEIVSSPNGGRNRRVYRLRK
jgi:hypothetical protein